MGYLTDKNADHHPNSTANTITSDSHTIGSLETSSFSLEDLIQSRRWSLAWQYLQNNPRPATQPFGACDDGDGSGGYFGGGGIIYPLHEACRLKSPQFFIDAILSSESTESSGENLSLVHNTTIQKPTLSGELPIHLLLGWVEEYGPPSLTVVKSIVEAYPGAVTMSDYSGRIPLHIASDFVDYGIRGEGGITDALGVIVTLLNHYPEGLRVRDYRGRVPDLTPSIMEEVLNRGDELGLLEEARKVLLNVLQRQQSFEQSQSMQETHQQPHKLVKPERNVEMSVANHDASDLEEDKETESKKQYGVEDQRRNPDHDGVFCREMTNSNAQTLSMKIEQLRHELEKERQHSQSIERENQTLEKNNECLRKNNEHLLERNKILMERIKQMQSEIECLKQGAVS